MAAKSRETGCRLNLCLRSARPSQHCIFSCDFGTLAGACHHRRDGGPLSRSQCLDREGRCRVTAMLAPSEVAGSLDQLVLDRELVSPETLARARAVQSETGERLDAVLTRLGLISEVALAQAIARATGFRLATSDDFPAEPVAAILLRRAFCATRALCRCVGLRPASRSRLSTRSTATSQKHFRLRQLCRHSARRADE